MGNMNELKQQPHKIIVQIACLVIGLALVFSFLVTAFSIYKIIDFVGTSQFPWFYLITLLTGVVFATLFGLGLKLANNSKVNLALLTLSITVPIFGFETYLEFLSFPLQQTAIATHPMSVINDTRTKIEVIDDFRSMGIDAYPNVSGSGFISTNGLPSPLSKNNIYPLGAIANKTTVYCNESGEWTIFESDEHGFNNPKGLYLKNKIDIMLMGDSFAEGACVRPNETIAAVLRESGINVVSLGKGGNGSLLELASLKEYAKPLHPKIVLWVHYANDIDDLILKGMQSSFLMNYLNDDDFSQNLISRQGEINDVLKNHVNRKYFEHQTKTQRHDITREIEKDKNEDGKEGEGKGGATLANESPLSRLIGILKLSKLREKLGIRHSRPHPTSPADEIFREILKQANEITSSWGGRFYFVYLHSFERYKTGREHDVYFRDFVLRTVTELRIPIIDAHKKVFVSHSDPLSLFPGREARHYNAEGYRLIAGAIAKQLRSDHLLE